MRGTRACAARALLGLFAGSVAVAVTLDNGLHTWQDWNERRRQILSFDFGITFVRRPVRVLVLVLANSGRCGQAGSKHCCISSSISGSARASSTSGRRARPNATAGTTCVTKGIEAGEAQRCESEACARDGCSRLPERP